MFLSQFHPTNTEQLLVRDFLVIHIIIRNACRSGNIKSLTTKNFMNASRFVLKGEVHWNLKVKYCLETEHVKKVNYI